MRSRVVTGPEVGAPPTVRRLASATQAKACARIMSTSEPWVTLGRDFDASLAVITAGDHEAYVALEGEEVTGFVVLCMHGALVGYLKSIAVREDRRSRGLGRRLMAFAEDRILGEAANVFLLVSSFNEGARRLYERMGYRLVGELTDYWLPGHSELLLRKTRGPIGMPEISANPRRDLPTGGAPGERPRNVRT
jgi:[ribosomal protein S18]-alanine N-acetyltransferase